MRPSRRPIVIATRGSPLAVAQAEAVARVMRRLHPHVSVTLLKIQSAGDQQRHRPLAGIGGKGLFTRAIEDALLAEKADLAVHSLKDLPTTMTVGLIIAAVPARADVRDVLIAPEAGSIDALPPSASVGTSSLRRGAQLLHRRPDLHVEPLRGNIDTRLRRIVDEHRFDATILAAAGLQRAGMSRHASKPIDTDVMLPAAGQGALAIQCRANDHVTLRRCLPLNAAVASTAVHAERQVVAKLGGTCDSPIGVLAEIADDQQMRLRAKVLSRDGRTCLAADQTGPTRSAPTLVAEVVRQLLAEGARDVLDVAAAQARAAADNR